MNADIENWKESVRREAERLADTIKSNEARLNQIQVESAMNFLELALHAVDCVKPE